MRRIVETSQFEEAVADETNQMALLCLLWDCEERIEKALELAEKFKKWKEIVERRMDELHGVVMSRVGDQK